jgi:Flp pilus assembly protein TadG
MGLRALPRLPRRASSDDGAAAVEFGLLLPLFVMLTLGTISAGFAFHAWLSVTHGAQESSRFAATLSIQAGGGSPDAWLATVGQRAFDASNLGTTVQATPGSVVCVAIYAPSNKFPVSVTSVRRVIYTAGSTGTVTPVFASGSTCPGMVSAGADVDYVQVSVSKPVDFNYLLGAATINVAGKSTNRFEAVAYSP